MNALPIIGPLFEIRDTEKEYVSEEKKSKKHEKRLNFIKKELDNQNKILEVNKKMGYVDSVQATEKQTELAEKIEGLDRAVQETRTKLSEKKREKLINQGASLLQAGADQVLPGAGTAVVIVNAVRKQFVEDKKEGDVTITALAKKGLVEGGKEYFISGAIQTVTNVAVSHCVIC